MHDCTGIPDTVGRRGSRPGEPIHGMDRRGAPGSKESAVGVIIVKKADPKLRYAVKANERISLWEFDERLEVRQVA